MLTNCRQLVQWRSEDGQLPKQFSMHQWVIKWRLSEKMNANQQQSFRRDQVSFIKSFQHHAMIMSGIYHLTLSRNNVVKSVGVTSVWSLECNCPLCVTKERNCFLSSRPITRRTRSSGDDLSFITSVLSATIFVFTGILTICQTVLVVYFESHLLLYYFLIKIICFVSRCNKLFCTNSVQPVHDFEIFR